MALPAIIPVALPVIHSAGGYIASVSGTYLAGTLSTTWVGAFVAGNTTLVGTVAGLVGGTGIGAVLFGG
jgi:hypothetical protein